MKKLLSICFLSILLGLLSFGVRAQSNNCSGFWIENLQPVTLQGVANSPNGDGTLVLDNVLNVAVVGNADLYELHFCPCELDPKTKVSVDWLLYRDGELVNDNLYNYVDQFEIYTLYPELNQQGQCQSIHWLGGGVPAEWGYCTPQAPADMFSGVTHCNPTNYPGALQVGQGTPGSVLSPLGLQVPAQGEVSVYSNNFDFFYLDFFNQTRTVVRIKWRQVGNYSLVMRIRQQNGGTAYDYGWGENPEIDKCGGHMSCCGQILAEDSIHYLVTGDFSKEVCENDNYSFGNVKYVNCEGTDVNYEFTYTVEDTLVLFGTYTRDHCCDHLVVDSVYNFHFFQRNTPEPIVQDTNLCQCTDLDANAIINMVTYDPVDLDVADTSYLEWFRRNLKTVGVYDENPANWVSRSYLPDYSLYEYSFSQQIFTSEEIEEGKIYGISFDVTSAPTARKLGIYLSTTNKDQFSSAADWDINDNKVRVFGGVVNFQLGWNEITFDTPFEYDGDENLLVTVVDSTGSWTSTMNFNTTNASKKAISAYRDYTGYTLNPGVNGTVRDYRSNVRFMVGEEGWFDTPVVPANTDTAATYEYTVRQTNVYDNFLVLDGSQYDTIVCTGEPHTFTVTIVPMRIADFEDAVYCMADFTDTTVQTVIAEHVDNCATTTYWFVANEDGEVDVTAAPIFVGDTFNITHDILAQYYDFDANVDAVVTFYAAGYKEGCVGQFLTPYNIVINQTPVLTPTITPEALVCPGSNVEMEVTITNNPLDVDTLFTYYWLGIDEANVVNVYTNEIEIADYTQSYKSRPYVPDYNYYNYGYTQQIYTAEEIGAAGPISALSFNVTQNPQNRELKIYLSTTDKDYFDYDYEWDDWYEEYYDYSDDWDLNDNKVLVYSGVVPFEMGWNEILLDTIFDYDGTENLLVTVVDLTGTYVYSSSSAIYFNTSITPTYDYMALSMYRDSDTLDNDNISEIEGLPLDYRSDIRFTMTTLTEEMQPYHIPYADTLRTLAGTTHSQSDYLPYKYNYKNTFSQQIYTAEEIGLSGTISSLSFNYAGTEGLAHNTKFEVYLGTTQNSTFASNSAWEVNEDMVMVYTGVPQFENGWNEIPFIAPYEYDGESNLVVTVIVNNSNYGDHGNQKFYQTKSPANMAMYKYSDSNDYDTTNITNYTGTRSSNARNEIAFNFTSPVIPPYWPFVNNYPEMAAYKEVVTNCDSAYVSKVYVIDNNGCKSDVVTFNYRTGDTIAPVVTPATFVTYLPTCDTALFTDPYTTVEAFNAAGFARVTDNCDSNLISVASYDVITVASDTTCETRVERTYTFMDSCHNVGTFKHILIGHDSVAPRFDIERPMRLLPVFAGNCTYNAPDSMTLINMIAPYVADNCTDSTYLMSTIQFVWENTEESPIGATNIFEVRDHLTISAIIDDRCGNSDTTVVFFLDRPNNLELGEVWAKDEFLCANVIDSLYFDAESIVDDPIAGPFTPYSYAWSELNGRPVIFSDTNDVETAVEFLDGGGDYNFVMTVTNSNGCPSVSDTVLVTVRPLPVLKINADVRNGATEPYCPTYGNLTVRAELIDPAVAQGQYIPTHNYTWSGESVNELIDTISSWVTIIPTDCDTVYHVYLTAEDDLGCIGSTDTVFHVAAPAPVITGVLSDSTVTIADGCALIVPDFKDEITANMITDECYLFSEIKADSNWYKQIPAAGDTFYTAVQQVMIIITNPCGKSDTTYVNALKPADYPTVSIDADLVAACYEDIMNGVYEFVATGNNLGNAPTWEWTVNTLADSIIGVNNTLFVPGQYFVPENISGDITYTLTVTATNTDNHCVIAESADFTVWYQGDDISTTIWNNTMCERNNGVIGVNYIPKDYVVTLTGVGNTVYGPVVKIQDVPYHESTPWNTVMFDSLAQGYYEVTVENLHGCERYDTVFVDNDLTTPDTAIYTVVPVTTCRNNNGQIIVTEETGYSYQLYEVNKTTTSAFTNLSEGTYYIYKENNATHCYSWTEVIVPMTAPSEQFVVDSSANTRCTPSYNGKITMSTTGLRYRIVGITNTEVRPKDTESTSTSSDLVVDDVNYGRYTKVKNTATSYADLPHGYYRVTAYNPTTQCFGEQIVHVVDGRVYPPIVATSTVNNTCTTTVSQGNGIIDFNKSDYSSYYLYRWNGSSWSTIANHSSSQASRWNKVIEGTYRIAATTSAGCSVDTNGIIVEGDYYYPVIDSFHLTENTSCNPDSLAYNGAVEFFISADGENVRHGDATCEYTVKLHGKFTSGDDWNSYSTNYGYLNVVQNDSVIAHLSVPYRSTDYTQTVNLISEVPATFVYHNGDYYADYRKFEILGPEGDTVWMKAFTDTLNTANTSYEYVITPNCVITTITPEEAFNGYIKNYKIKTGTVEYPYSDHNAVYGGLNSVTYHFTVTSKYNCKVDSNITIPQRFIPEMELVSTPNTMCNSTFEKPGNGTVVIINPVAAATDPVDRFVYNFYDENGQHMDVPYNLPMTHTKYWLDDQTYHVVASERGTGCMKDDYITVDFAPTTVVISAHSIPNYSCTGSNGVIVIDNVYSSNEDAKFGFSLDADGPYTSATEFTGLPNGTYTIYAYDSTLLCTYHRNITINPTDSCAPVISIWDSNEDALPSYHYCWGAQGIQLNALAVDTCDNANFSYHWYAPCANPSTSDTTFIDVQTDHYVVNGCDYLLRVTNLNTGCQYDSIVNVFIHPNPELYLTINNDPVINTLPRTYCEDEVLTVAVHNNAQYGEALDVNSIEWTSGYIGNGIQAVQIQGDTLNDHTTICVRAANEFGCMSNIISVPVDFSRKQYKTVTDVACSQITIAGTTYGPVTNDSTFTVTEVIDMDYTWQDVAPHSCDTIVTHNVTLYASPKANFNVIDPFKNAIYCGDTIVLDDIKDAVAATVTPASATVKIQKRGSYIPIIGYQWENINETTVLNYSNRNDYYRVMVSNNCGDIYSTSFRLKLQGAPTVDTLMLYANANITQYCPGQTYTVRARVTNPSPSSTTAYLRKQNGNTYDTIASAYVSSNANYSLINFTNIRPYYVTFNDTLISVVLSNNCGTGEAHKRASVDTIFTVPLSVVNPHCEGTQLTAIDFTYAGTYTNSVAYRIGATQTQAQAQVISLPYTLQLADTNMKVYFDLTSACGYHKITTQATVQVIPNARINLAETWNNKDMCYGDAINELAEYRTDKITTTYASQEGWVIGTMVSQHVVYGTQLFTDAQLRDTVYNRSGYTYVGYKAISEQCTDTIAAIGRLRILAPLQANNVTITLCPEDVNNTNIKTAAIAQGLSFNRNNYNANEVDTTYKYKNANNQWVEASNISAALISSGAQVIAIFAPKQGVHDCGVDTGYITVNIKDTSRVAPVLQPACEGHAFREFIASYSQWNGDASILVDSFWTVKSGNTFVKFTNMDTVFTQNVTLKYVWQTTCADYMSAEMTTDIKFNPTVNFNNNLDTINICVNTPASELPALPYTVTDPSNIVSDTVLLLNGDTLRPNHVFTNADQDAKIVVKVNSDCADATDTIVVNILQLPVPEAAGDARICLDNAATMHVVNANTNKFEYAWVFNGDTVSHSTTLTANFAPNADNANKTDVSILGGETYTVDNENDLYHFTVVATEISTGCVSTTMVNTSNDPFESDVITIKSTDAPQFLFTYQGDTTHTINGLTTGALTQYTWQVNVPCTAADKLVYVEYTIYHNGEVINNDSLSNYLLTQQHNGVVTTNMWVTKNVVSWLNSDLVAQYATTYHRTATPNFLDPTGAQIGNHFPNNNLAFANSNQYDDLYMHFLNGNAVTKTIAPFLQGGEYKIVYRLLATTNEVTFGNLYYNTDSLANLKIGGHNANGGIITELAVDSIILNVAGENLVVNETPAAPSLAPSINTEENVIVPEMEVWPNPAPSIITTFKARVYNMSGDATVTITNFAGKQVYSGNIYIDSDNFYFEADVNSLAVGAYIMSVRTQDAVVTKKLVVTVRQ